jgi:hypothetical protein
MSSKGSKAGFEFKPQKGKSLQSLHSHCGRSLLRYLDAVQSVL